MFSRRDRGFATDLVSDGAVGKEVHGRDYRHCWYSLQSPPGGLGEKGFTVMRRKE